MSDTLARLADVLQQRKQESPESSYVAGLYHRGLDKILEKVGEEAVESILAAKNMDLHANADNRQQMIGEMADLWFHSLVALAYLDLGPEDVLSELDRRFGLSGLEEKASRSR